jgi:hypothetical protein
LVVELFQTLAYEEEVAKSRETERRRLTVTLNRKLRGLIDAVTAHFPTLRGLRCDLSRGRAWGATKKIGRLYTQLPRRLAEIARAGPEQDRGASGEAAPGATPGYTFRRRGDYWEVGQGDHTELIRDSLGMRYIAVLLSRPGTRVNVRELYAAVHGVPPRDGRTAPYRRMSEEELANEGLSVGSGGKMGFTHDGESLDAIRARIRQLEEARNEARKAGETALSEEGEEELVKLKRELREARIERTRQGRNLSDPSERVRKAVTIAIERALKRIRERSRPVWQHLTRSIKTGVSCSYCPDHPTP